MINTIEDVEKANHYIGDGVYVIYAEDGYWLVTSDGIMVTNEVFLGVVEVRNFINIVQTNIL